MMAHIPVSEARSPHSGHTAALSKPRRSYPQRGHEPGIARRRRARQRTPLRASVHEVGIHNGTFTDQDAVLTPPLGHQTQKGGPLGGKSEFGRPVHPSGARG